MTHAATTTPRTTQTRTSGRDLAQQNPLAFLGAAFTAGLVGRVVLKGTLATARAARRRRSA